jgi:hypothetical protein
LPATLAPFNGFAPATLPSFAASASTTRRIGSTATEPSSGAAPALGFAAAIEEPLREAVLDEQRGPESERAIATATAADVRVEGVGYRKVLVGLDHRHPRAALLLHNALHASLEGAIPASITSPAFVDDRLERYRPLAPLLAWVADLQGGADGV